MWTRALYACLNSMKGTKLAGLVTVCTLFTVTAYMSGSKTMIHAHCAAKMFLCPGKVQNFSATLIISDGSLIERNSMSACKVIILTCLGSQEET
mmetsp:Transcript_62294/g.184311  ORF Transcript_62294/g.184311 Transcript_62294/m.184311 type:complete len:94 (+) Transcript_62294:766-1047(+)